MSELTTINNKERWLRRLNGEVNVPTYDGDPDYGFYKVWQGLLKTWWPIGYWYKDGKLFCLYNGEYLEEDRARELWVRASEHAITAELFKQINDEIKAGARPSWPGENAVVTRIYLKADDNSLESIEAAIKVLNAEIEAMLVGGPLKTKDDAEQVSDAAKYMEFLNKRADAARKKEKDPHWQAGLAVDQKWKWSIETSSIYTRAKQLVAPFLKWLAAEKQRKLEAARAEAAELARKAQAAIDEAEQARLDAVAESENEGKEAATSGSNTQPFAAEIAQEAQEKANALIREANEAKQKADDIAATPITSGKRTGSIHLRTETIVTINDYAAAAAFVINNEKVKEAVTAEVTRLAKTGVAIPGVTVTKDKKAA